MPAELDAPPSTGRCQPAGRQASTGKVKRKKAYPITQAKRKRDNHTHNMHKPASRPRTIQCCAASSSINQKKTKTNTIADR